jgi:hypothetical protein|nr:MAG TPA: hypothetical protein [Caudoviricetes sp.]
MKKLKTQTGLVREEPVGKESRMIQKPPKVSNKKAAKQRKAAKLKDKKETKAKRKQGGKGRPFRAKPWADYAKGERAANAYSTDELRDIVKRAAKAANNRLRALEKAGLTKSAYQRAIRQTGKDIPRYREKVSSATRQELQKEFYQLRDFMTAPTSTVGGMREHQQRVLKAAQEMGFKGDVASMSALFEKYMTAEWENLLGSDIIYEEIVSGRAAEGSLDEIRQQRARSQQFGQMVEDDRKEGAALLQSLRKHGKKRNP